MITRDSPSHPQQSTLPGILGGLGPLAHIEFEKRLLHHSVSRGAVCDQDHPNWLLISAASTPDRTKHLSGQGESCLPSLIHSACLLEAMGASFLVVTCNTAHAFYSSVQAQLSIPWLHMMNETAQYIATTFPTIQRVGVLATTGTVRSHLYTRSLEAYGLNPIIPDPHSTTQNQVMQAIYSPVWGIKASGGWVADQALTDLTTAYHWLMHEGAELVIAGCTELSVGLSKLHHLPLPWVDPLDIMANLTLDLAYDIHPLLSIASPPRSLPCSNYPG